MARKKTSLTKVGAIKALVSLEDFYFDLTNLS